MSQAFVMNHCLGTAIDGDEVGTVEIDLYWLLGISVLKPGNKQSWRRPSPRLSDVWIARNMNGERSQ
jgi:hypothetical protein